MRTVVCVVAIMQVTAAFAVDPLPPSPGSVAEPTAATIAPPALDLIRQLERLAAGKPLPVAAVAEAEPLRQTKPLPDVIGKPLLDALGLIGDAFSAPLPVDIPTIFQADTERGRDVFQPYAFRSGGGNVWTVGRDRRLTEPAPTEGPDTLSNMPDIELGQVFYHSLNATQLGLATKAGLRWSDFSDPQKHLLKLFLGRPYALYRNDPQASGGSKRTYSTTSETPLSVERCTLHLYIGFENLLAPTGKIVTPSPEEPGAPSPPEPQTESYSLYPQDLTMRLVRREVPWMPRPVVVYDPKMKPSDLPFGTQALSVPIGVRGITTLEKAVTAAAQASKMPLVVDKRLGCREAFVGDSRMTCGDAMRLLAYSFDGAWRKVGSKYLLTWDREGSLARALEVLDEDELASRQTLGWDAIDKEMTTPDWQTVAEKTLGPPPGLPLCPTPEQWKALTAPPPGDTSTPAIDAVFTRAVDVFAFDHLDAAQQRMLREAFADRMTLPSSDTPNAPFPSEAFSKSKLGTPRLFAYLDIPGVGSVNITRQSGAVLALDPTSHLLEVMFQKEARDAETKRQEALKTPPKLNFTTKAVAPPPLTAGEWERLFAQMQRKGLDTVYVPVFWDGQTLFPSKQFPQLAVCRGEDLLAKVLALAKPRKLHVIAVVSVLAWRLPSSEAHYLSRRPELVDVDATGRSRREWGLQHPPNSGAMAAGNEYSAVLMEDRLAASDFVRPTVPEVRSRLLGLVRELRRYKGLDGVALARWTRIAGSDYAQTIEALSGDGLPRLGYTLPERVAFLSEKGVDPVDVSTGADEQDCDQTDYYATWTKREFAQDSDLAKALLAELGAGWPGRTQIFAPFDSSSELKPPDAPIIISTAAKAPAGKSAYLQVAPPSIPPPEVTTDGGGLRLDAPDLKPEEARGKRLDYLHVMLAGVDPNKALGELDDGEAGLPAAKGIVLDFTGSPDLLWDGLAMLPNK